MQIQSIHTHKVTVKNSGIFAFLDTHVKQLSEKSVLAITSKVLSICEGRAIKMGSADKATLIESESEYFLPPSASKYDIVLTISNNLLVPSAGIDESNGNGYYILWPKDPQASANAIRQYLCSKFGLSRFGVIITDSRTSPLKWGTTGVSLAHTGFAAINNYIGTPDIFGRKYEMTTSNVVDALAISAVVVMGEGREQTPLAVITDVPFVRFQERNPTEYELKNLHIDIADDVYAPLLTAVDWLRGGRTPETHWVYILHTSANTLYIGQTNNLEKRLAEHKKRTSKSAKYMRYFDSFALVYREAVATRSLALKREAALKRLTRKQKDALIISYSHR